MSQWDSESVPSGAIKKYEDTIQSLEAQVKSLESKPKRPVSRQDVLRIALEVGFSISTAYGQESGKLMPISDSKTLERFAQALAEINEGDGK